MTERLTVEESVRYCANNIQQERIVEHMFGQIQNLFICNNILIDREKSRYWIDRHENTPLNYSFTSTVGTTRYILTEDSAIPCAQCLIEKNYQIPAAFYVSFPPSLNHLFSLSIANYPSQGYAYIMPSNSQESINTSSSDEVLYARLYATHILINPQHIIELQMTSMQEWKKIELFQLIQEKDEKKSFDGIISSLIVE